MTISVAVPAIRVVKAATIRFKAYFASFAMNRILESSYPFTNTTSMLQSIEGSANLFLDGKDTTSNG
jgi:hypothetical protein